ncbi:MAG: hypothetical protein G01um101418_443 [Parcubacteria group bacterium Gr01-1014_18]|nr:MAG: hypothetical protein Greene041636_488 [Parcubacteria group bacterium Greene0416_36]TSC81030.1 MAG: hypothetical protein G01um101418_443 [Parcubacteria group bacterium Gr01-1014_18]TSC98952.1 MAG: hypothetical protein Greene101420_464 [Parcubacteria group bacterium Greene1014_20]TSD06756.1 MAG: hypothetical protein Greene07142_677 [Parcubacteria group bacterium Greene0714_2]
MIEIHSIHSKFSPRAAKIIAAVFFVGLILLAWVLAKFFWDPFLRYLPQDWVGYIRIDRPEDLFPFEGRLAELVGIENINYFLEGLSVSRSGAIAVYQVENEWVPVVYTHPNDESAVMRFFSRHYPNWVVERKGRIVMASPRPIIFDDPSRLFFDFTWEPLGLFWNDSFGGMIRGGKMKPADSDLPEISLSALLDSGEKFYFSGKVQAGNRLDFKAYSTGDISISKLFNHFKNNDPLYVQYLSDSGAGLTFLFSTDFIDQILGTVTKMDWDISAVGEMDFDLAWGVLDKKDLNKEVFLKNIKSLSSFLYPSREEIKGGHGNIVPILRANPANLEWIPGADGLQLSRLGEALPIFYHEDENEFHVYSKVIENEPYFRSCNSASYLPSISFSGIDRGWKAVWSHNFFTFCFLGQ